MRTGRPKGTKQSSEAIEKIRRASAERWRDPTYRAHHLPLLLAAGKLGGQRYREKAGLPPPKGTPERRMYEKVRAILGPAAARSLQLKSAETDRAGAP